ncbi:transposase [Streptomyces capillispiralis]|uniref:Transposase n=1 Tax=Streptomyces capillispiralis TaxID=68182 RepID=A0A561SGG9_9ACTN|nr:transposase [Streptomyces capillispiralis]
MTGGEPALLLALLVNHGQEVLYMPGRLVNRASDGYRGEGKTDARDAYVIADQARMRRDLRPIRPGDEAAVELKLLTGRRADLVEDRTRVVNPPARHPAEHVPGPGTGPGCHQHGTAQAADGLPDPGPRSAWAGITRLARVAGQPQGPQCQSPWPRLRSRPPNASTPPSR